MPRSAAVLFGVSILLLAADVSVSQNAPQAPVILKGAPMGGVRFDHPAHLKVAAKCELCHHPSRPEKPLKTPQEACGDCHTRPATPPVNTNRQKAFHNPTATSGLCIDCHRTEDARGKGAPLKCVECHKAENT